MGQTAKLGPKINSKKISAKKSLEAWASIPRLAPGGAALLLQDVEYFEEKILLGDKNFLGDCFPMRGWRERMLSQGHVCSTSWEGGLKREQEMPPSPAPHPSNSNYNLKEEFFRPFFPINYHQAVQRKSKYHQRERRGIVSISDHSWTISNYLNLSIFRPIKM